MGSATLKLKKNKNLKPKTFPEKKQVFALFTPFPRNVRTRE